MSAAPLKHERERAEGVRCRRVRCQYHDYFYEQSCSAAHADDDECVVAVCRQYEPTHTVKDNKEAGA